MSINGTPQPFTFTAPSGKQFVKIEINGNSPFPFTEYGDWTQPELNQILWSGTAASTVTLGGSDDTYAHDLSSIVFYFEDATASFASFGGEPKVIKF